ncbi:YciI family protein [Saccharothrix obliqua]|uniref:YciI family protein n=1 Tax=Saccharothrix obliqua TaxID=2861747 RepID=UPI001C5CC684|nr:YciI family protein [Saccharothrix obliqua]MBW4716361.1 hypothetical protein [Saccharothrix obliqua]
MRFLLMHRHDENAPETLNPSPEFIERMGAFIQDAIKKGILITAEGVHPSAKGARVRKERGAGITASDGPFTETKEIIGGFALINARNKDEAVAFAHTYADLFEEIEVEVRQVFEEEDLPSPA